MVHNDQMTTERVGSPNVEHCIMECGLIYIGKRTMICLHTFQDEVFCVVRVALLFWLLTIHILKTDKKSYRNKGFKCHLRCKTIQLNDGQSSYSYVNYFLIDVIFTFNLGEYAYICIMICFLVASATRSVDCGGQCELGCTSTSFWHERTKIEEIAHVWL